MTPRGKEPVGSPNSSAVISLSSKKTNAYNGDHIIKINSLSRKKPDVLKNKYNSYGYRGNLCYTLGVVVQSTVSVDTVALCRSHRVQRSSIQTTHI